MADLLQQGTAANIIPPSPMQGIQTLSGILGIRQAQQDLQTGLAKQQTAQIEAAGSQMTLNERQNVAQIVKNGVDQSGHSINNPDGTLNMDYASQWLPKAAPSTWPTYMDKFQNVQNNKQIIQQNWSNLNKDLRGQVSGAATTLLNDPTASYEKAIAAFKPIGDANPEAVPYITSQLALLKNLDNVQTTPGNEKQALAQKNDMIIHAMQIGDPKWAPQTEVQNLGGVQQPVTVTPGIGQVTPVGEPMKTVIPAGYAMGPNNQLVRIPTGGAGLPLPGGAAGSTNTPTGSASPASNPFGKAGGQPWTSMDGMPAPNAPGATQQAWTTQVKQAQTTVNNAREQDQQYGINMSIADTIRHLASSTKTGPGTSEFNRIAGLIGSRYGANNIADYQQLGAFLDNQAARLQASMGIPNTNAGMTASQAISGNTEYQQKAIIDKDNYLQALTEGQHQYRQMMDRVEKFSGTPNPTAVAAAQAAWANNFDPRVYELQMAHGRGGSAFKEVLSGITPDEAQQLKIKRKNLQLLASGQMPQ